MARWVIKERIGNPDQLPEFDYQGYRYSRDDSTSERLVFLRDAADQ